MNDPHSLLGKRVRVKMDDHATQAVAIGQLLGFGDGFVHHCWPMLAIEEDV